MLPFHCIFSGVVEMLVAWRSEYVFSSLLTVAVATERMGVCMLLDEIRVCLRF